jgi:hypothetical protein
MSNQSQSGLNLDKFPTAVKERIAAFLQGFAVEEGIDSRLWNTCTRMASKTVDPGPRGVGTLLRDFRRHRRLWNTCSTTGMFTLPNPISHVSNAAPLFRLGSGLPRSAHSFHAMRRIRQQLSARSARVFKYSNSQILSIVKCVSTLIFGTTASKN